MTFGHFESGKWVVDGALSECDIHLSESEFDVLFALTALGFGIVTNNYDKISKLVFKGINESFPDPIDFIKAKDGLAEAIHLQYEKYSNELHFLESRTRAIHENCRWVKKQNEYGEDSSPDSGERRKSLDLKDATMNEILDEIAGRMPLDLTSIEGFKTEYNDNYDEIVHNIVTIVSVKPGQYGEVYLSGDRDSLESEFDEQYDGPCGILIIEGKKRSPCNLTWIPDEEVSECSSED